MVTAFTNAAIDNLLAKLAELQASSGLAAAVPIRKLDELHVVADDAGEEDQGVEPDLDAVPWPRCSAQPMAKPGSHV
jgi:hypothetical protein